MEGECEGEGQGEEAGSNEPRYVLKVVHPHGAVVRDGIEIDDSESIRIVPPGEEIEAFGRAYTSERIPRYNIADGWISARVRGGSEEPIVVITHQTFPFYIKYRISGEDGSLVRSNSALESAELGVVPSGTVVFVSEKKLEGDVMTLKIQIPEQYRGWITEEPALVEEVIVWHTQWGVSRYNSDYFCQVKSFGLGSAYVYVKIHARGNSSLGPLSSADESTIFIGSTARYPESVVYDRKSDDEVIATVQYDLSDQNINSQFQIHFSFGQSGYSWVTLSQTCAARATNRAGISMTLGTGDAAWLYYCGRRLGVDLIPGSDGQCGPHNGPQCSDCHGFTSCSDFSLCLWGLPMVPSCRSSHPMVPTAAVPEGASVVCDDCGDEIKKEENKPLQYFNCLPCDFCLCHKCSKGDALYQDAAGPLHSRSGFCTLYLGHTVEYDDDSFEAPYAGDMFTSTDQPSLVATCGNKGDILIWNHKGHTVRRLQGHGGAVNEVVFCASGKRLVSVSDDETVKVWDVSPYAVGDTVQILGIDDEGYYPATIVSTNSHGTCTVQWNENDEQLYVTEEKWGDELDDQHHDQDLGSTDQYDDDEEDAKHQNGNDDKNDYPVDQNLDERDNMDQNHNCATKHEVVTQDRIGAKVLFTWNHTDARSSDRQSQSAAEELFEVGDFVMAFGYQGTITRCSNGTYDIELFDGYELDEVAMNDKQIQRHPACVYGLAVVEFSQKEYVISGDITRKLRAWNLDENHQPLWTTGLLPSAPQRIQTFQDASWDDKTIILASWKSRQDMFANPNQPTILAWDFQLDGPKEIIKFQNKYSGFWVTPALLPGKYCQQGDGNSGQKIHIKHPVLIATSPDEKSIQVWTWPLHNSNEDPQVLYEIPYRGMVFEVVHTEKPLLVTASSQRNEELHIYDIQLGELVRCLPSTGYVITTGHLPYPAVVTSDRKSVDGRYVLRLWNLGLASQVTESLTLRKTGFEEGEEVNDVEGDKPKNNTKRRKEAEEKKNREQGIATFLEGETDSLISFNSANVQKWDLGTGKTYGIQSLREATAKAVSKRLNTYIENADLELTCVRVFTELNPPLLVVCSSYEKGECNSMQGWDLSSGTLVWNIGVCDERFAGKIEDVALPLEEIDQTTNLSSFVVVIVKGENRLMQYFERDKLSNQPVFCKIAARKEEKKEVRSDSVIFYKSVVISGGSTDQDSAVKLGIKVHSIICEEHEAREIKLAQSIPSIVREMKLVEWTDGEAYLLVSQHDSDCINVYSINCEEQKILQEQSLLRFDPPRVTSSIARGANAGGSKSGVLHFEVVRSIGAPLQIVAFLPNQVVQARQWTPGENEVSTLVEWKLKVPILDSKYATCVTQGKDTLLVSMYKEQNNLSAMITNMSSFTSDLPPLSELTQTLRTRDMDALAPLEKHYVDALASLKKLDADARARSPKNQSWLLWFRSCYDNRSSSASGGVFTEILRECFESECRTKNPAKNLQNFEEFFKKLIELEPLIVAERYGEERKSSLLGAAFQFDKDLKTNISNLVVDGWARILSRDQNPVALSVLLQILDLDKLIEFKNADKTTQRDAKALGDLILRMVDNLELSEKSFDASTVLPIYTNQCKEILQLMVDAYKEDESQVKLFQEPFAKAIVPFCWKEVSSSYWDGLLKYVAFLILYSFSVAWFDEFTDSGSTASEQAVAWTTQAIITGFALKYLYHELVQARHEPIQYLKDPWNYFDIASCAATLLGELLLFAYTRASTVSRVVQAIASVLLWFKLLYYCRAHEQMGPVVSMILIITSEMKYFLLVLFIVFVGFGQAFFLLNQTKSSHIFGSSLDSLYTTFTYMLGGFDATFAGDTVAPICAKILLVAFLIVTSLILLNLLIAKMGDSYSKIQAEFEAHWRLEQAIIFLELIESQEHNEFKTSKVLVAVASEAEPEQRPSRWSSMVSSLVSSLVSWLHGEDLQSESDVTYNVMIPGASECREIERKLSPEAF